MSIRFDELDHVVSEVSLDEEYEFLKSARIEKLGLIQEINELQQDLLKKQHKLTRLGVKIDTTKARFLKEL